MVGDLARCDRITAGRSHKSTGLYRQLKKLMFDILFKQMKKGNSFIYLLYINKY